VTLPLLLSIPHAGLLIPTEVKDSCILSMEDIIEDSDEGAAEIYLPLQKEVSALVTTDVARAVLDINRAEDDRGKDGGSSEATHLLGDSSLSRISFRRGY